MFPLFLTATLERIMWPSYKGRVECLGGETQHCMGPLPLLSDCTKQTEAAVENSRERAVKAIKRGLRAVGSGLGQGPGPRALAWSILVFVEKECGGYSAYIPHIDPTAGRAGTPSPAWSMAMVARWAAGMPGIACRPVSGSSRHCMPGR